MILILNLGNLFLIVQLHFSNLFLILKSGVKHTSRGSIRTSTLPSIKLRKCSSKIITSILSFISGRLFFFQAEDGIRDTSVLEFRRVLFRSSWMRIAWVMKSCQIEAG